MFKSNIIDFKSNKQWYIGCNRSTESCCFLLLPPLTAHDLAKLMKDYFWVLGPYPSKVDARYAINNAEGKSNKAPIDNVVELKRAQ